MNTAPSGPESIEQSLLEGIAALARLAGRPVTIRALRAQATHDRDGVLQISSLEAALAGGGIELRQDGVPAGRLATSLPALLETSGGGWRLVTDAAGLAVPEGTWTGNQLRVVARPAPDRSSGIPDRPRARSWFWGVLWGLRSYYAHVALATLILNLLSIAVSLYVMNVYDRVVPNRTYDTLWVLTIGTLAALGFEFLARTLRGWLVDSAGKRADLEISSGLFRRLLESRLIDRPASSGAYASNLRDFEAVRDVLTSATLTALIDLPFFVLFVAVIAAIAPTLAIVPLVCAVLVAVIGLAAQGPLARHIRASMKDGAQRQGLAIESIEGIETLKVNNAQGRMLQRWEWLTEAVAITSMKSRNLSSGVVNATVLIQQLATVATVVAGVYLIHDAKLTMGGLIGVVILCGRAIAPLGQLAGLAVRFQQARSALDGLQVLFDKPIERDPDRTYLGLGRIGGEIAFSRVDFAHDPQGAGLFRGLNLIVPAGQRVAILGRTGSGKSTLLRLAAGLYAPHAGLVTLDGVDMRQVDPAELRAAVGLLPQDARLFLGTLRENLELARSDTSRDDDSLVQVLRLFGLDRMVAAHPRGLDLPLGEDGQGLSTGQKRLVCLARLALRDSPVWLLDEPTSGLDPSTEKAVLSGLAQWSRRDGRDHTLVIVTHRSAVLEIVDRVIVIEQGRIVLDGPRDKVVEQLAKGVSVPVEGRIG